MPLVTGLMCPTQPDMLKGHWKVNKCSRLPRPYLWVYKMQQSNKTQHYGEQMIYPLHLWQNCKAVLTEFVACNCRIPKTSQVWIVEMRNCRIMNLFYMYIVSYRGKSSESASFTMVRDPNEVMLNGILTMHNETCVFLQRNLSWKNFFFAISGRVCRPKELVGNVFRCLVPILNNEPGTVITPLLNTGGQVKIIH